MRNNCISLVSWCIFCATITVCKNYQLYTGAYSNRSNEAIKTLKKCHIRIPTFQTISAFNSICHQISKFTHVLLLCFLHIVFCGFWMISTQSGMHVCGPTHIFFWVFFFFFLNIYLDKQMCCFCIFCEYMISPEIGLFSVEINDVCMLLG